VLDGSAVAKKTMSDHAQNSIHIKYIRSGIGFDFHTKIMIRSLGLYHINQVVKRQDTAQIRGQVAKIPHFVEIVEPQTAAAWLSTPEYTIQIPVAKPVAEYLPAERKEEHEPAGEVREEQHAAHQEKSKKPAVEAIENAETTKHKKYAKHAEPTKHAAHAGKEKSKSAKADKPKKHDKAAETKAAKHEKPDKKGKK
jgi:large subunit ribosomal protein L30